MALRRIFALMVTCILSQHITSGTQCLNGFVTKDVLAQKAASLGENMRRENQQRLIPEIKFTCSAILTLWIFVAEDRGGGSEYPALQVWRPQNEDETQYTKMYEITNPPIGAGDTNVYKYFVQPVLAVQAGDILGIYQPSERRSRYSIIYQGGGGPVNYRRDRLNTSPDTFDLNERNVKFDQSDYPLVGVQISNSTCASGFLSMDALIAKGKVYAGDDTDIAVFDREQRLIPGISFGCNGWLNKWIVATVESSGRRRNSSPQLQIWRPSTVNSQTFTVTPLRLTTLQQPEASQRNSLNMYEYVLRPPIQFRAGDVFGLHQPEEERSELLLHFQEEAGSINYLLANQDLPSSLFSTDGTNVAVEQSNLPLVNVEITVDCGRLQHPRNGSILYSSSTTSGSIATYHCHRGYTLSGMETRSCQVTNAQWSGSAPTCQPVNCGSLPAIPHGKKTPTRGMTTFRSEVKFSCEEGFILEGTATATCMADGRWSRETPACRSEFEAQEGLCSNLPNPENGVVTITATRPGTVQGLRASYTCVSGYRLTGPEVRTCQENRTWSGEQPACQLIECEILRPPDGGTVAITSTSGGIGIGSIANYSCNNGFYLEGEPMRVCQEDGQEDGQWSVEAPVCRMIECENLNPPEDGTITITPNRNGIGVGSIANYSCSHGFELLGNPVRACQENGQWTSVPPICRMIECENLTNLVDGTVIVTPSPNTNIGIGSVANYSCNYGFQLMGDPVLRCQENGHWTTTPPVCTLTECEELTNPDGGTVVITPNPNKIGVGSVAKYSCNHGFELLGELTVTCQENGQWTNMAPVCRLIECEGLTDPDDGIVTITPIPNKIGVGSIATYSCNHGFELEGDHMLTCQENGQWTNTAPVCIMIECQSLTDPGDGTVAITPNSNEIGIGSAARYTCNPGFDLVGPPTLTCQESGQWNSVAPVCIRRSCNRLPDPDNGRISITTVGNITASYSCDKGYKLAGNSTRICQLDSQWSGEEPTCEAIDCGISPEVEYGVSSTNGSTLYSVTVYNCSIGYKLIGNSRVVCEQNESWSGLLPTCEAIDCGLPPEVANGSASTNRSTLYSVAVYNCSVGYRLSDNTSRLVCQANESWSGRLATCELVECVGLAPPENGNIMLTDTTVGSTASYSCKEGYLLDGDRIRTCMDSETWSGKPPQCSISQNKNNVPPSMNSSHSNLLVIIIIVILVVLILAMCGIIIFVYTKRKRSKNTNTTRTVNNHQHNSVENPLYTGVESGNESLYPWSCSSKEKEAAAIELQPISKDQKSDGPHYYDLAEFFQHNPTGSSSGSRSPRYEVATASGAFHSYEFADDNLHYEMASNASQYEVPVSPYEIPTPQGKIHNIYGTIQWGTYVPTKEQRGLSGTSVILQSTITPADKKAFFEESDIYWKPASDSASLYEQLAKNKYREILRHQIQMTEHLGSGQFGTVHKGLWQSPGGTVGVAVKTLNAGATENDKVKFLQESAINGQFQHPNVVQLHGVVTVGEPVMIVLELLNGDLRNYLTRQRPVPGEMMSSEWPGLLLEFCRQIASGMEYLAKKAFIHRDLAARNILVANDKTCKISDFGMSRDLEDENYYISNGGKIPVKWTAPEALHFKKYSTASDVWSFGIVMFEIWSLGHKPFEGLSNPEAIKMADMGFRLTPPPGCPRAVYHLMIRCWHPETASRPNFTAILRSLSHSNDPADLLCWTEEDIKVHPQAAVLGAALEAGRDLYPELQMAYRDEH